MRDEVDVDRATLGSVEGLKVGVEDGGGFAYGGDLVGVAEGGGEFVRFIAGPEELIDGEPGIGQRGALKREAKGSIGCLGIALADIEAMDEDDDGGAADRREGLVRERDGGGEWRTDGVSSERKAQLPASVQPFWLA